MSGPQPTKRKLKDPKPKGVWTPDPPTKKDNKVKEAQTSPPKQKDITAATPAGKMRRKDPKADEQPKDSPDNKEKQDQQVPDPLSKEPSDEKQGDEAEMQEALLQEKPQEEDNINKGTPEPTDTKKCCKCSQGNCLKCQCSQSGRPCTASCKALQCANREQVLVPKQEQDVEEAAFVMRLKQATNEDLAKELYALTKATKIDMETKYMMADYQSMKARVMDTQSKVSKMEATIRSIEKKLTWMQEAIVQKQRTETETPPPAFSAGKDVKDLQVRGSSRPVRKDEWQWPTGESSGTNSIQEFFDEPPRGQEPFNMERLEVELTASTEPAKVGKSLVLKFFKEQPTASTIKKILSRMGCGLTALDAMRVKRVGKEFIAVIKMKSAEDAQRVLRNKTMLRGSDLWIGPDKYEEDWDSEGKGGAGQRRRETQRVSRPPLSSYPHTELWADLYRDTSPSRHGYEWVKETRLPGNGRKGRRGGGTRRAEERTRPEWIETRF